LSKTAGLAARVEDFAIEDRPKSAQAGREIAKFFFLTAIVYYPRVVFYEFYRCHGYAVPLEAIWKHFNTAGFFF